MLVCWSYLWIKRIDGNADLCALTLLLGTLFSCLWTKTKNKAAQCIQACRRRWRRLAAVQRMREECGWMWLNVVVGDRLGSLHYDHLHGLQRMAARQTVEISSERQLHGDKRLVWCQGSEVSMGRLTGDHRNATVTQITAGYNQSLQTSFRTHNAAVPCATAWPHTPRSTNHPLMHIFICISSGWMFHMSAAVCSELLLHQGRCLVAAVGEPVPQSFITWKQKFGVFFFFP